MFISPKPRIKKVKGFIGSLFIWGGAVLPAKVDGGIWLGVGGLMAVIGSWLIALALVYMWDEPAKS